MKERLNKIDKGLMLKFSTYPHREGTTIGQFYENIASLLTDKEGIPCSSGGMNISRIGKEIEINGKLIHLSKKQKARIISIHRMMEKAVWEAKWGVWEKRLYKCFNVVVKS